MVAHYTKRRPGKLITLRQKARVIKREFDSNEPHAIVGLMGAPTGFIFISYRRKDVPFAAHALHCHLARRFPERQLFMDVQGGIRAGLDFAEVIRDRVARCNVLLALIGPSWMQLADARLDDPGDFVRLEIASALDMRKRVIPILVENADMPRTHLLPEN